MKIGIDVRFLMNNTKGISRYISKLISELAKIDNENIYYIFSNDNISLNLGNQNFYYYNFPVGPFDFVKEQLWLTYHTQKLALDIFHSTFYLPPLITSCKNIYNVYDLNPDHYPELYPDKKMTNYFKKWRKLCLSGGADRIITCSNYVAKQLITEYKLSNQKIENIYLAGFLDKHSRQENTKETIIPNSFIFYLGQITPWKNLEVLIKAFHMLKNKSEIKEKLILGGELGWYSSSLINLVDDLNLKDEVIFTGYLTDDEAITYLNKARLFVFPSLLEGFGLPVLEAMHFGVPVISSDRTSLPEIIRDAGILFNPEDIDELTEKIYLLLTNQKLYQELIEKGLKREKEFNWRNTAEKVLKVYKEI